MACAVSTDLITGATHPLLAVALELHPQVALRPEPFGNRRLVFLKHGDMVAVARILADHPSLADALRAANVEPHRWPSFATAFESLRRSEVVRER